MKTFLLGAIFCLTAISAGIAHAQTQDGGFFHGYPCLQDCSGHEAGFKWAKDNGITDPATCGGKSTSFIEGCQAAAGQTFDPSTISPAAGGSNPADPALSEDPFIEDPFYKDPFAPDDLPVMQTNPFGQ